MATRIVDLDRGKLVTYPGNSTSTCWKKKKPCAWKNYKMPVRSQTGAGRGVDPPGDQSTPTRNEGRVRALKAMRRERGELAK